MLAASATSDAAATSSAAATSQSGSTGASTSTGGTTNTINAKLTVKLNFPPSSLNLDTFAEGKKIFFPSLTLDVATVLGIPASAILEITIDLDQSTDTQTVIQFTITNILKGDGTRVDPVAASLKLKNLIATNDPSLSSTTYLAGVQIINSSSETTTDDASSGASAVLYVS
jgi:hypothetical protein